MALTSAFFDAVRKPLFGGTLSQKQVDALDMIVHAWGVYGDDLGYDQLRLAYVLATAYHETARFKYMREVWGPTPAQKRYEGRKDLGNTVPGDGKRFMGRGFVQITGRRNYNDWAKRLGVDIVARPDLAQEPEIAARILVQGMLLGTFTGKKLQDYINSDQCDYVEARRIVNGTDRASLIAGYAKAFEKALAAQPVQAPKPAPAPTPVTPAPKPSKTPAGAVWGLIAAILAGLAAFAQSQGWFPW